MHRNAYYALMQRKLYLRNVWAALQEIICMHKPFNLLHAVESNKPENKNIAMCD